MARPMNQPDAASPKTGYRKAAFFLASVALAAVVVTVVVTQQTDTQELAKTKKPALKYGSSITLMTAYNEYITTDKSGHVTMDGFKAGDNVIKVISPKGGKGGVKYGDSVSLMGANGKYFLARYSAKVTSRSNIIAKDSTWKVTGGSGDVMIGDRVSFKDEFGYLTVDADGASTAATEATVMQKYLIGLPGQENGLKLATGLSYGEVVTFHNKDHQYLQINHNGWGSLHGHPEGNWDHFAILSNQHREGHVSYGDQVVLRAHNGRFVSVRQDNRAVEAVSRAITDQSLFQMLGSTEGASTGYIHSRDMVVLKASEGFVTAFGQGADIRAAASATQYSPACEFIMTKVWDSTL